MRLAQERLGLTTDARATAPAILALVATVLAADGDNVRPDGRDAVAADGLTLARLLIDRALAGYLAASGVVH